MKRKHLGAQRMCPRGCPFFAWSSAIEARIERATLSQNSLSSERVCREFEPESRKLGKRIPSLGAIKAFVLGLSDEMPNHPRPAEHASDDADMSAIGEGGGKPDELVEEIVKVAESLIAYNEAYGIRPQQELISTDE